MLLVPTKTLQPGMILAQPIFHPTRGELVLLNRDHELHAKLIARLREFNVSHVWVRCPDLRELDERINLKISSGHIDLYNVLEGSINRLERRVAIPMNLSEYKRCVAAMLNEIIDDPNHEVITHQLASCAPLLAGHQANCCYLSLLLGARMSGYLRAQRSTLPVAIAENTSQLGIGALLHDVGKLQMPEEMEAKNILSEEASWPEYRMHAQVGYKSVRDTLSPIASNVILNHHQRFDGTGFPALPGRDSTRPPEPQEGENIHIFSRIVGVVDAFDNLLCPNGTPTPTIVALRLLRSERFQGWFDPVVVHNLLEIVPPFLVGSMVTLSNGAEAVVIENHPEAPCRPTVRFLGEPVKDPVICVRGRQIDLRMSRSLTVAAADGVDVSPYVFTGQLEPVA